jgi:hypothetical protein
VKNERFLKIYKQISIEETSYLYRVEVISLGMSMSELSSSDETRGQKR